MGGDGLGRHGPAQHEPDSKPCTDPMQMTEAWHAPTSVVVTKAQCLMIWATVKSHPGATCLYSFPEKKKQMRNLISWLSQLTTMAFYMGITFGKKDHLMEGSE